MKLSCAFATSLHSHEHIRIAESLGYRRAFLYDSPAFYPDVWVQLCRAAEVTDQIGLGPGVLIPSLRHPMVTAAAVATLAALAGADRVTVGVGSGFTGRMAMGKRPVPWADVHEYVLAVRRLLHGELIEWDDSVVALAGPDDRFMPDRPIETGWVIAADGPKGYAVAHQLGAEVIGTTRPNPDFASSTMLVLGTILRSGEDPGSPRVLDAAGYAAGVAVHWAIEHGMVDALSPSDREWAAAYDDVPADRRHLALHDRHLVAINERDRPFVDGAVLTGTGLALSPAGWRDKLAALRDAGATEIAYQPAGADIPGELERFAELVRG